MIKTIVFNTFIHSIPFVFGEKERVCVQNQTKNLPTAQIITLFSPFFKKGILFGNKLKENNQVSKKRQL